MIKFRIDIRKNILNKKHIDNLYKLEEKIIKETAKLSMLKNINFSVIIMTEKDLKFLLGDFLVCPSGIFCKDSMTIYLRDDANINVLYDTYCHELGHLIDFILGKEKGINNLYTSSIDLTKIIEKEAKHMDYLYSSDPKEFFAQAFSECFRHTYHSVFMEETKLMFKNLLEIKERL